MRKTLVVVTLLCLAGARSQAQSSSVLAGADFGLQPDPATPAAPAQFGNPLGQGMGMGPTPYGNGEQPVLRFAGDNAPQNQFTFSLFDDTGYDDNVLGGNINRFGDFYTSVGPRVAFVTARKKVAFNLDYGPRFEIFKRFSGRDAVNQSLNLDFSAEVSPRWQLRARTDASESYYGWVGGTSEQVVAGLGAPGGNTFFVNPNTRTITDFTRVDFAFNKSARTTLDLFVGYSLMNVKLPGGGIIYGNYRGGNAGWSYSYRVSARSSVSATYVYGESRFAGVSSHYANQNLSLSYAYQISARTSVSFFGGPEYTYVNETLLIPVQTIFGLVSLPYPIHKPEWDWSAGFGASKTTNSTTFSLSASHFVSGGGGLLTAVNSNFGSLGISRRLPWNWTGDMRVRYGQNQALSFGGLQSGRFSTFIGGLSLNHKLGERAGLRLNYEHLIQRGNSSNGGLVTAPGFLYANLDRNRGSIGIDWQIGKVHLGH
jgi:hypothetical protein